MSPIKNTFPCLFGHGNNWWQSFLKKKKNPIHLISRTFFQVNTYFRSINLKKNTIILSFPIIPKHQLFLSYTIFIPVELN